MHDIGELQRRLGAALERIDDGLGGLSAPAADTGEDHAAALEAERAETARLRDEIAALEARHAGQLQEARTALESAQDLLTGVEKDRNRLKAATEALSEAARSLRDANAKGVSNAELINDSALVEIDALKTMRHSDRTELEALMRLVAPVVKSERESSDA